MPSPLPFTKTVTRLLAPLAALLFLFAGQCAAQIKNLKPQGYVNDFAGVLSASAKDKLTALCAEIDHKAGAQIAVVTVSSLGGASVEQFTLDLATQWGVGPKQLSRGLMILVATGDHKYRFEVGYGLEGILPDGKVGGFGREAVPLLRQNDYDGAVLLMTQRVAAVIAQDKGVSLDALKGFGEPQPSAGNEPKALKARSVLWIVKAVFYVIVLIGFLILMARSRGESSGSGRGGGIPWWLWFVLGNMTGGGRGGGSWGGGSSWGGGGGGGGFGGFGGGSFGGGGASGSW